MSGDIRQQLYDRIRETSKDEVILDEMIRLGYWQQGEGKPSLPEELIKRKGELDRELSDLYRQQSRWANPEAALKQMHKERKRAAMERRKETKLRQAAARHQRALAWEERRKRDVLYLGAGVSGGLSAAAAGRALTADLPEFADAKALADAMGIALAELRFLAYNRALTRISHYQRFRIPKKSGGERQISAPMPRLKRAQYWILDNILARVPIHPAAQGFAPGRSILTNAAPHVGRGVVINLDLKDFFPTLTWKRVKGKFRGLGYSEAVATVLALVCTEPDVDEVMLDGKRLYAARGPRRLPQGAPTSPALTNLICWRLDRRLNGIAAKLGFAYTRYADDMTFSASGEAAAKASALLKFVQEIVTAEGFTVHPKKTRVMRAHSRQEVTGLVVNERIGVPRGTLRRFRALLHGIEAGGPEGKRWGGSGNVLLAAMGFARFVHMVDAEKGAPLVAKAGALAAQYGGGPARRKPAPVFRARAAAGQQPLERWWTPGSRPAPRPEPVLVQQKAAGQKAAAVQDKAPGPGAVRTAESAPITPAVAPAVNAAPFVPQRPAPARPEPVPVEPMAAAGQDRTPAAVQAPLSAPAAPAAAQAVNTTPLVPQYWAQRVPSRRLRIPRLAWLGLAGVVVFGIGVGVGVPLLGAGAAAVLAAAIAVYRRRRG